MSSEEKRKMCSINFVNLNDAEVQTLLKIFLKENQQCRPAKIIIEGERLTGWGWKISIEQRNRPLGEGMLQKVAAWQEESV